MASSSTDDAPHAPPSGGTQRCGNFDACGVLVTATDGAGLCTGCRSTVYCGATCQKAHWKAHKLRCKEIKRQRAKDATLPKLVGAVPPFAPTLAAARAGNAVAQLDVAAAYGTGTGVAQSWSSAFEWLTRCAAQAAPPCEVWCRLGGCYQYGRGVAKDEAEAVRLFRLGAAAGDAGAQFSLACCLESAIGVPTPDFAASFALYTAAAAQDHAGAILNLGVCYGKGRGVARDAPRAIALWKRALAHPDAAQSGVALAARMVGASYCTDDGVPVDRELGARYLRQAAALGDEPAARVLRELGLD